MCELLGMSSNRRATLNLSLMRLAEHGGHTGPHKDGWGVAYFEGADIRLIKDPGHAADSDWIRFIGQHDLRSQLVIAHIRKATMGKRAYCNTQPFMRELAGRMHLFAHNGSLPEIEQATEFNSRQYHPVGDTDSEKAFCTLMSRMAKIWTLPKIVPPLEQRMIAVSKFAGSLKLLGLSNFIYSDGDALFAHGDRRKNEKTGRIEAPGLVYLRRRCQGLEPGLKTSGLSISGTGQDICIIASVPLDDAAWKPLKEGEVIAVSKGSIALHRAPS